jgi:hypothetical protein
VENLPIELYLPEKSKLYPFTLMPENIYIGLPVYFKFSSNRKAYYSIESKGDKDIFYVTDIERVSSSVFAHEDASFSNGAVRLTIYKNTPPAVNDDYISIIHNQIGDLMDYTEIEAAIRRISSRIPVKRLGISATRKSSRAYACLTVAQRLDLCNRLVSDNSFEIIGTHQRNLVVYLLLTCFDRLGQPAPYSTFEQFLRSKKASHKRLREDALKSVVETDYISTALILNQAYNKEYGVRNSFYRFIEDVLPSYQLDLLLDSIMIVGGLYILGDSEQADDITKKKYLYALRNSYTHQAESKPGTTIPFATEEIDPTSPEKVFYFYEDIRTDKMYHWVSFSQWPKVLIDCVKIGLVTFIRQSN